MVKESTSCLLDVYVYSVLCFSKRRRDNGELDEAAILLILHISRLLADPLLHGVCTQQSDDIGAGLVRSVTTAHIGSIIFNTIVRIIPESTKKRKTVL